MKYFVERSWCVNFFFVMDSRRPMLPFGICGPFAKKREAKKVAAKLRAKFPERDLGVYGAWLAKPFQINSMVYARRDARADLKAMLGA
ncbi:hypothetical protein FQZ97_826310 [compost metagenome]